MIPTGSEGRHAALEQPGAHAAAEVDDGLDVDPKVGLSTHEAERRAAIYGANALREPPRASILSLWVDQGKAFQAPPALADAMATSPREGLFTDLYEFTMAQAYLEHGRTGEATFDVHVRELPANRGYMVTAGIHALVQRLATFSFTEPELSYLGEQGLSDELLSYLANVPFEAEIRAIPEGRLVFPHEPIAQITAPLPVAQVIETLVLNTIHVHTLTATKASRCFTAVGGPDRDGLLPDLVDFGARRAHGRDAALAAARSAYIAGFAGTSLVEAGRELDIPIFGTMAHSFVQASPDEREALAAFARSFPGTTLLIDTYDTLGGARRVVDIAKDLGKEGIEIGAVRIDSGDLEQLSNGVRAILDDAGLDDVRIIVSGGLDEHALQALTEADAPIDGYGVGTSMVVSADHPSLNISYKLCTYEGEPVIKTSPGKQTLPGRKQVHRRVEDGRLQGDTIALVGEEVQGEPLLTPYTPMDPIEAVQGARERFLQEIAQLPAPYRDLARPPRYPVERSKGVRQAIEQALARVGALGHGGLGEHPA